jgi:hypothetical protein
VILDVLAFATVFSNESVKKRGVGTEKQEEPTTKAKVTYFFC